MTALSSWAASGRHRALSNTEDDIQRLAIALGAVRSVIRVIDPRTPPLNVDWADTNVSYTDLPNGEVRINPAPIIDGITPSDEALDVVVGFGMHEAGHSADSRSVYDLLVTRQPNGLYDLAFKPTKVAAYVWNVVEDIRMEAIESRKWPGFAPYFGRVLDWLWRDLERRDELPDTYGDKVSERLMFAFISCRFPDKAQERWGGKRFGLIPRDTEQREMKWWQAWRDRYLAGEDPRVSIQAALDHLAEGRQAKDEMREMTEREEAAARAADSILDLVKRWLEEGVEGAPDPCPGGAGDPEERALEADVNEQVGKYVREGFAIQATPMPANGRAPSAIASRKPEEDHHSQRAFVGRPDATSEALRSALVFRASAPEWTEKLLKSGELDDEELYRWAADDYRVFGQKVVESKPEVLMGLLVDLSGSMEGRKLVTAQRLAQLFVYALHDQAGVETHVWGHTADHMTDASTEVFTLWEPGDPMTRLGLIQTLPHHNNADGHAIAWCAARMMDAAQPQKVLFVLSDGRPSAREYGREEGMAHVAECCAWARDHGVEVIQIAIDPDLRPAVQAAMFGDGNWIGYQSDADLPRQLAALMGRFA